MSRLPTATCFALSMAPIVLMVLGGLPLALPAQTQPYPSKPIRIIAPFAPGAGTDTLARTLAGPLSKALGQNVLVENRPGAGTVVGTEAAARAPGDGHTLLIVANSFTINPAVRTKLPYDAQKDFTGFTADLTVNISGKATSGPVIVKSPREVSVQLADADVQKWAQENFEILN